MKWPGKNQADEAGCQFHRQEDCPSARRLDASITTWFQQDLRVVPRMADGACGKNTALGRKGGAKEGEASWGGGWWRWSPC